MLVQSAAAVTMGAEGRIVSVFLTSAAAVRENDDVLSIPIFMSGPEPVLPRRRRNTHMILASPVKLRVATVMAISWRHPG
jgi:hypothetical protein